MRGFLNHLQKIHYNSRLQFYIFYFQIPTSISYFDRWFSLHLSMNNFKLMQSQHKTSSCSVLVPRSPSSNIYTETEYYVSTCAFNKHCGARYANACVSIIECVIDDARSRHGRERIVRSRGETNEWRDLRTTKRPANKTRSLEDANRIKLNSKSFARAIKERAQIIDQRDRSHTKLTQRFAAATESSFRARRDVWIVCDRGSRSTTATPGLLCYR